MLGSVPTRQFYFWQTLPFARVTKTPLLFFYMHEDFLVCTILSWEGSSDLSLFEDCCHTEGLDQREISHTLTGSMICTSITYL